MATWPGNTPVRSVMIQNTGASTDLVGAGFDLAHRAHRPGAPEATGANVSNLPITLSHEVAGAQPGATMAGPGNQIFERIHVLPTVKAYPFILSTLHVPVEVWNAFRDVAKQVSAITLAGPAGVSIVTPYVLPLIFPAFTSKVFDVQVDANGAAQADNTILFDFDGLAEPFFRLTGLRQLPFTISPDWDAGIDDVLEWVTDVQASYDDTEQRMSLRDVPNRSLSYKAAGLDEREGGLLMSLLWSWQARNYGVPVWMDAQPLQADVLTGQNLLLVDTTEMGLAVDDTVIVIVDAFTWFASPVNAITSVSLQLETALDKDFFAGITAVIPIRLGVIAPEVQVPRPTNRSAVVSLKFDLVVVKS
jgi:hypothetical protein